MKKALTQLSEEELLDLLDSNDTLDEDHSNNEFNEFISLFKLKPGTTKVPFNVIKKIYSEWSKTKVDDYQLRTFIQNHFVIRKSYVYLDNNPINSSVNYKPKKFDKLKSPVFQNHYKRFILDNSIEKGSYLIRGSLLYHLFKIWNEQQKKSYILSEKNFYKFSAFYLEKDIVNKLVYFKINKEYLLNINTEILENEKKEQKTKTKTSSLKG